MQAACAFRFGGEVYLAFLEYGSNQTGESRNQFGFEGQCLGYEHTEHASVGLQEMEHVEELYFQ